MMLYNTRTASWLSAAVLPLRAAPACCPCAPPGPGRVWPPLLGLPTLIALAAAAGRLGTVLPAAEWSRFFALVIASGPRHHPTMPFTVAAPDRPRLLPTLGRALEVRHYSRRTEE